jgi:hypothetical protein
VPVALFDPAPDGVMVGSSDCLCHMSAPVRVVPSREFVSGMSIVNRASRRSTR